MRSVKLFSEDYRAYKHRYKATAFMIGHYLKVALAVVFSLWIIPDTWDFITGNFNCLDIQGGYMKWPLYETKKEF